MSKLLKRDRRLDSLRSERRTLHTPPAQRLLLTYQPSPPPNPAARLHHAPRPRWISRRSVSRIGVRAAACATLLAAAVLLTHRGAIPPAPARASIAQRHAAVPAPSIALTPTPTATPSLAKVAIAERRVKEMDRAMVEARQVMALMEQAVRQAVRAYASTPAPSAPTASSSDTRS